MTRTSLVMCLALVATAFAGCVLPGEEGVRSGSGPDPIVKRVTLTINEEDEERLDDADESAFCREFLKTTLEFTYDGPDVPTEDLAATFMDCDGEEAKRPLDDFTQRTTLRDGDIVKITPVNVASGLVVKKGLKVLASREGRLAPWFEAAGVPVPFASTQTGALDYELDLDMSLSLSARDFTFPDSEDQVRSLDADYEAGVAGTFTVRTTASSSETTLGLDADLEAFLEAGAEMEIRQDGEWVDQGVRVEAEAELESRMDLVFDGRDALKKVGSSSRVFADGSVHVWDDEHPRSEQYEPEDVEHPFIDEETEYDAIDVEPSEDEADAHAVDFLTRLWSARIGVGDSYSAEFTGDGDDGQEFRATYDISVVSREPRIVSGHTYDTYRVSQVYKLLTEDSGTKDRDYDVQQGTLWVEAEQYIPVYEQITFLSDLDRDDLEDLVRTFDEDFVQDMPSEFDFGASAEMTVKLKDRSGNFTTAPLLSTTGIQGIAYGFLFTWMMAAFSGLMDGEDEYDDYEFPEQGVPDASFSAVADPVGRLIVVTHEGGDSLEPFEWAVSVQEVSVEEPERAMGLSMLEPGDGVRFARETCGAGHVSAGQTFDEPSCEPLSPGMTYRVRVLHTATNSVLFMDNVLFV